jgi:hypothetical protein
MERVLCVRTEDGNGGCQGTIQGVQGHAEKGKAIKDCLQCLITINKMYSPDKFRYLLFYTIHAQTHFGYKWTTIKNYSFMGSNIPHYDSVRTKTCWKIIYNSMYLHPPGKYILWVVNKQCICNLSTKIISFFTKSSVSTSVKKPMCCGSSRTQSPIDSLFCSPPLPGTVHHYSITLTTSNQFHKSLGP